MDQFEKCWQIKKCEAKGSCDVFPHFGRSCWLIKTKLRSVFCDETEPGCEKDCESCEVYQWHLTFLKIRGQQFAQLSK